MIELSESSERAKVMREVTRVCMFQGNCCGSTVEARGRKDTVAEVVSKASLVVEKLCENFRNIPVELWREGCESALGDRQTRKAERRYNLLD